MTARADSASLAEPVITSLPPRYQVLPLTRLQARPSRMVRRARGAFAGALLAILATHSDDGLAQAVSDDVVHEFPFLDDESSEGSRSVGDTSSGYLVGAKALEESERLGILPRQRERGLRYGSDDLIAAIGDASGALYRAGGTKLWVGNVARKGGGDLQWSVSHNSGRDADIAFAYLDRGGRPAIPPDLVPLNSAGASATHGLRFDVLRTWLVVKALLESPHAAIQYIFISTPLKNMLLVHAKRTGESAALLIKAAEVLHQPSGAGAHDDHLHVRVYCSERDTLAGCNDAGVVHAWHLGYAESKRRRIGEVERFLTHAQPSMRQRAIARLVLLDARGSLEPMAAHLKDEDAGVRRAAVDSIGAFGQESHVERLAALWHDEPDVPVRLAILGAAAELGGSATGKLLAIAVGVPERGPSELEQVLATWQSLEWPTAAALAPQIFPWAFSERVQSSLEQLLVPELPAGDDWLQALSAASELATALQVAALDAAARSERLEPLDALANLLQAVDADVRSAADRALAFTTNHPPVWRGTAPSTAERAAGVARWRHLLANNGSTDRPAWLVAGFRAAGFRIPELQQSHAWELVRATASSDHLSFNAQRTLMRLFDHRPLSLTWRKEDACTHWLRWLEGNRRQYRLSAPKPELRAACGNAKD